MEWRLIEDGIVVAGGTDMRDAVHYAMKYGQDGPVELQIREPGKRWRKPKLDISDARVATS